MLSERFDEFEEKKFCYGVAKKRFLIFFFEFFDVS